MRTLVSPCCEEQDNNMSRVYRTMTGTVTLLVTEYVVSVEACSSTLSFGSHPCVYDSGRKGLGGEYSPFVVSLVGDFDACTDVNTVSSQHIAVICYTLTRSSSCAFHKNSHSISCSTPCLTTCTVHPAL